MEDEPLEPVVQRLIASRAPLDGLAQALPPEQLAGASAEEFTARAELAIDVHHLLGDAVEAVESSESVEVIMALVNAIDGLAVQLRDRVLDGVVASNPAPDMWPDQSL